MIPLRRNATANLLGRLTTGVLWIVSTPFVLSHLGPVRFGIWSLFFTFYAYLTSLDLGIGNTMVRFVASQRPSGGRQAIVRTIQWGLVGAIGLGLVWGIAMEFTRGWVAGAFKVPPLLMPEALDALAIFGVGVMIIFPTQALVATLQGFERIDLSNLCVTIGVVVHVVVLCVLLSLGGGLRGAAIAGAVSQVVSGLLAAFLIRRQVVQVPIEGRGAGPPWREMLHFSVALQFLWVLILLQNQSGKVILGLKGNLTMVTDYELAFRVAFAISALPLLIRDPVIPSVSRLWESDGRPGVTTLFITTSRWVYVASAFALGLLWLLAPDIARVWLGPGHERIAELMRLWAIAFALNLLYAPGVAIARGIGMPRYEIWSYAAALVTNVGLAVWWVPRWGTAGVVMAFLASYGVGLLVFAIPFHRGAGIMELWPWLRHEFLPRLAAGLIAIVLTAIAVAQMAALLPGPGWVHAAVTGLLFAVVLATAFYPLGDTQMVFRSVLGIVSALRGRVTGAPPSSATPHRGTP